MSTINGLRFVELNLQCYNKSRYQEPCGPVLDIYIQCKRTFLQIKKPNNKKVQNQQKSLERKITKLEERQTSLEFELYETSDAEKLKEIQSELDHVKREIEKSFELLMSIGN